MKDFLIAHFDKLLILGILLSMMHSAMNGNAWAQGEVHGLTEALLTLVVGVGVRAAYGKSSEPPQNPQPPKE